MSDIEKEQIKKIAKLRSILEKRIEESEIELDGMKTLLEVMDKVLLRESFKTPEIVKTEIDKQKKKTEIQLIKPSKKGIQLKTVTGDLLAEIFTEQDIIRIALAEDKEFNINTPPFNSFFVDRVLAKMVKKDQEDTNLGKLDPENIISFQIQQENSVIKEIIIRHLRSERLRELKSSIRWTLEKMYERMKQANDD